MPLTLNKLISSLRLLILEDMWYRIRATESFTIPSPKMIVCTRGNRFFLIKVSTEMVSEAVSVALSISTGEITVGVVQQSQIECFREEQNEAEETDEIEHCSNESVQKDESAVAEHQLQIDVSGSAHDKNRKNKVQKK